MRPLSAIPALFLLAGMLPMASYGQTSPGAATPAAEAAPPSCPCPAAHHAWRPYRHARVHHRHWRRAPAMLAPVALAPLPPYDPQLPSPYDSAYDRAMTLHFRSPEVSGTWVGEPRFPHTPPVHGVRAYRIQSGTAVLQYDGLTGEYITLSQADAQRAFPPSAPAATTAPAPAH
jgi:hypothetical protein